VDTTLSLGRNSFPFSPKSSLRIAGYLPLPLLQHFPNLILPCTPPSIPFTTNRFTITTVQSTFKQNAVQLDSRSRTPDASPSNLRGKSEAHHRDMVYCGQNTRRGHHSIGCEVGCFVPIVVAFSILLAFTIDITHPCPSPYTLGQRTFADVWACATADCSLARNITNSKESLTSLLVPRQQLRRE
jgi:hypothetical protein